MLLLNYPEHQLRCSLAQNGKKNNNDCWEGETRVLCHVSKDTDQLKALYGCKHWAFLERVLKRQKPKQNISLKEWQEMQLHCLFIWLLFFFNMKVFKPNSSLIHYYVFHLIKKNRNSPKILCINNMHNNISLKFNIYDIRQWSTCLAAWLFRLTLVLVIWMWYQKGQDVFVFLILEINLSFVVGHCCKCYIVVTWGQMGPPLNHSSHCTLQWDKYKFCLAFSLHTQAQLNSWRMWNKVCEFNTKGGASPCAVQGKHVEVSQGKPWLWWRTVSLWLVQRLKRVLF